MTRAEVDSYIAKLDAPAGEALGELCAIIREVDPRIAESIKWNAPSFAIVDHFATTGIAPKGGIRLVLHTGAVKRATPLQITIDGADGLLDWKGSDRAVITFGTVDEVRAVADTLRSVVRQWIAQSQEGKE